MMEVNENKSQQRDDVDENYTYMTKEERIFLDSKAIFLRVIGFFARIIII